MAIDLDNTPRMHIEHSIDMDVIEQFGKIMGVVLHWVVHCDCQLCRHVGFPWPPFPFKCP